MEESGFQVAADSPRSYQENVRFFMAPLAEALVRSVEVGEGDAVVDVATGTGFAARIAAETVGPDGRVAGIDINQAMVAFAKALSAETEDGIEWSEASALELPFEDGSFDAAICQQGIQFFPDPMAGLREMARVTRRGGRVAVTVWSDLQGSPYFEAEHEMLIRFCDVAPEELTWTVTAEELTRWFVDAGLSNVSARVINPTVALPAVEEYLPKQINAIPFAEQFAALTPQRRADAIRYVDERLAPHATARGITVPFSSHLVVATL